ncbi:MAG TPA: alpha/beta hydrolase [Caulobacteraceae bacterium]|jgi:pimeloyl-ACP methyl ester carboxylesterase
MHVEVHEGHGPLLLLVHGICSSRAQWRPNLAGLAEFCTPVVVELLGHGRSESPEDSAAYTAEAYIGRFEAIRADLGAERWLVCGQSFGAGLTLGYALAHPERVIAQVFTNSASALGEDRPRPSDEAITNRIVALEARGRAAFETMPFYPKRTGRLAAEVEEELIADAALITLAGMARTLSVTSQGLAMMSRLGEVTTPTLLVNGVREKSFQPLRDRAATALPSLEIVDLQGGHPVNLDRPDEFNAAVRAFVGRHL